VDDYEVHKVNLLFLDITIQLIIYFIDMKGVPNQIKTWSTTRVRRELVSLANPITQSKYATAALRTRTLLRQ
jgi:hypothetical protein